MGLDVEVVADDQAGTVELLKTVLCRLEVHRRVYDVRRKDGGGVLRRAS